MDTGLILDLAAIISPTIGIIILLLAKVSITGMKAGSVARLNAFFISAVTFDIFRLLGYYWAVYGIFVSIWLLSSGIGTLAATFYYCPESRSVKQTISRLGHTPSFQLYNGILLTWLVLNFTIPSLYLPTTLILLCTILIYPSRLFLVARKRTDIARVKSTLTVVSTSWACFVAIASLLLSLGAQPSVLGLSFPYAWEVAFMTSSVFYILMSKAIIDPTSFSKSWSTLVMPETMFKLGKRYLIIHDSGAKTRSILTSSFKSLVGAGTRIVMKVSTPESILQDIVKSDQHFRDWVKQGKLVGLTSESTESTVQRDAGTAKPGLRSNATVYVTELDRENLQGDFQRANADREPSNTSELFLLENSKAPRSGVAEFMRRNADVQLVDLADHASPFSRMINLDHSRLQDSAILLEYGSGASYGDVVDKFLTEEIANSNVSVLFTSKSSNLYRAFKGRKGLKLVAASSMVSAPDELPDGEVQIPDKELGLVTSIASDILEGNKNLGASFVFDSLTELIRAERWEQVYSGVKQLLELLSVPNATALFLVNSDSFETRFLGALRALFSVQMRLDANGLQVTKLGPS